MVKHYGAAGFWSYTHADDNADGSRIQRLARLVKDEFGIQTGPNSTSLSTATRSAGANSGVSASRLYWEYKGGFFNAKGVSIPVAVSVFPGEQYEAPRSWAEQAYPNLIHYNEVEKVVTSPPGNSRNCSRKRCAPAVPSVR